MNRARQNRVDALMDLIVVPTTRAVRDRPGSVVSLRVAATRRENLRAFDALIDGMRVARGHDARIEALHDAARAAIASFPIPLLGPGMLRLHVSIEDGNEKIGNLLEIILTALKNLKANPARSLAEAFCVAFSKRLGISVEIARIRILRASHDCEFFSPELVLMLEAWIPPD